MTEKYIQSYPLSQIKTAFADPNAINRTFTATTGALGLGMDNADVAAVVQGLSGADFNKSMTSYADSTVWQDVYKPIVDGRQLYVKFTLNAQGQLLLISFKEA